MVWDAIYALHYVGPSEREDLVPNLLKEFLLRVGGGMGCYLLIGLSRHSEREDFGGLLGVF